MCTLHRDKCLIPPTCSSARFQRRRARKSVVVFSWIHTIAQTPSESSLKGYCEDKAWKHAIKAVSNPRYCLWLVPGALEAKTHEVKAKVVKGALWNLSLLLCPPGAAESHMYISAEIQELLRFPRHLHENQHLQVSLLARAVKLNLEQGSLSSYKLHRTNRQWAGMWPHRPFQFWTIGSNEQSRAINSNSLDNLSTTTT